MRQCPQSTLACSLTFTDMVFHPLIQMRWCSDWAVFASSAFFWVILKHTADMESFHLCIRQVHAQSLRCVRFFAVLWTVTHQAPLSVGFSRPEYWSGLLFPPPGESSWPRDRNHVSCVSCTEPPGKPLFSSESPHLAANYPAHFHTVYLLLSFLE